MTLHSGKRMKGGNGFSLLSPFTIKPIYQMSNLSKIFYKHPQPTQDAGANEKGVSAEKIFIYKSDSSQTLFSIVKFLLVSICLYDDNMAHMRIRATCFLHQYFSFHFAFIPIWNLDCSVCTVMLEYSGWVGYQSIHVWNVVLSLQKKQHSFEFELRRSAAISKIFVV